MLDIDFYPFLNRVNRKVGAAYEKFRSRRLMAYLSAVDPLALERLGEREALRAFHRAAAQVPYYRKFLAAHNIRPKGVKTIDDFRSLPLFDKQIFHDADIADLAVHGSLAGTKNLLTSSGFSGIFSFGINLAKNLENTVRTIDAVLDYVFQIRDRKTLLINCLPMGVKVLTNAMTLAEVSVREDMALALLERFGRHFDQIIIVGEAFFLKYLVEEGIKKGVDWHALPVSLICGEDSFPETYRDYMAGLLGIDLEERSSGRLIGSSLGIAEIDLNLFHETPDTIKIRRLAENNSEFRIALFGDAAKAATPMLFHYYPHRTYLEANDSGELIATTTFVPAKIPLIRYNIKDCGRIISWNFLERTLKDFGRIDLVPRLHLPLVSVQGRHSSSPEMSALADRVRQAIFAEPSVAGKVTGYFRVRKDDAGPYLDIQLKKEFSLPTDGEALKSDFHIAGLTLRPVPYYEFQEALTLDYNKKFYHF